MERVKGISCLHHIVYKINWLRLSGNQLKLLF